MFGRTAERAQIEWVLDAVVTGPAGIAVEGMPGIGKTTLWRDAVERARRRGYRVLETAPAEPDAAMAFAGLGDLVDRLPDEVLGLMSEPQRRSLEAALSVGDAIDAPSYRQALPRAILAMLRGLSAGQPLVVAIDDEQWLDRPSARVLAFALCRLRDEQIGVLLARRPDSHGTLARALSRGFGADGIKALILQPLDMSAIQRLLSAQANLALPRPLLRRIHEASGGNPLFALAIARELEARRGKGVGKDKLPIPRTLADAVAQRLAHVDPRAHASLLAVAALSHPTLALLQDLIPDFALSDLDRAEQVGVIEIDGDRVRFTHPLLASTYYGNASAARRRELHRLLASILGDEEKRAHHLALGAEAPDSQIAATLEQAAGAAAGRGAPEVAADLLEEAARLTPSDAVEARRARTIAASEQHFASGDVARARELLEVVLPDLPHGPERARALRRLALTHPDDLGVAEALLEDALASAGEDHRVRVQIEIDLMTISGNNRGNFAAMVAHARSAVESAERSGDPGLLAQALGQHAVAALFTGRPIQREVMLEGIELEDSAGATTYYLPASALGQVLFWCDELDGARPVLERAVERALKRGEEYDAGGLRYLLAFLEWEAGNPEAAERYRIAAEEMDTYGDEASLWRLWIESWFAAGRGELEEAHMKAEQGLALAERDGYLVTVGNLAMVLAAIELWTGHAAAAHDRLHRVRESFLENGFGLIGAMTVSLWSCDIEALIATRRLDEAEQVLGDLLDRARASENPHALAISLRCKGLLLAARGDLGEAIDAINSALADHARRPLPLELGRTLLEKGSLERRAKRKGAAKRTLEQALAILEPLDAAMWVSRARDELSRIGLRRATAAEGLTPAQARVAELAAAGLSNREIAGKLYMSTRSVESHLTKVYREFGVKSRAQLIAALARRASETSAARAAGDNGSSANG